MADQTALSWLTPTINDYGAGYHGNYRDLGPQDWLAQQSWNAQDLLAADPTAVRGQIAQYRSGLGENIARYTPYATQTTVTESTGGEMPTDQEVTRYDNPNGERYADAVTNLQLMDRGYQQINDAYDLMATDPAAAQQMFNNGMYEVQMGQERVSRGPTVYDDNWKNTMDKHITPAMRVIIPAIIAGSTGYGVGAAAGGGMIGGAAGGAAGGATSAAMADMSGPALSGSDWLTRVGTGTVTGAVGGAGNWGTAVSDNPIVSNAVTQGGNQAAITAVRGGNSDDITQAAAGGLVSGGIQGAGNYTQGLTDNPMLDQGIRGGLNSAAGAAITGANSDQIRAVAEQGAATAAINQAMQPVNQAVNNTVNQVANSTGIGDQVAGATGNPTLGRDTSQVVSSALGAALTGNDVQTATAGALGNVAARNFGDTGSPVTNAAIQSGVTTLAAGGDLGDAATNAAGAGLNRALPGTGIGTQAVRAANAPDVPDPRVRLTPTITSQKPAGMSDAAWSRWQSMTPAQRTQAQQAFTQRSTTPTPPTAPASTTTNASGLGSGYTNTSAQQRWASMSPEQRSSAYTAYQQSRRTTA
jgi:hypothetical protein